MPYEDTLLNKTILDKVAIRGYLKANQMLKKLVDKHPDKFKCSFSFSGTVLEQMETHRPDALQSFKDVISSGNIELFAETYYHSLAYLFHLKEFEDQVEEHRKLLQKHFNVIPVAFRNTELIYNNSLAKWAAQNGYKVILTEGVSSILKKNRPNYIYSAPDTKNLKVLLRNTTASDDIAYRFQDKKSKLYPLTPKKYLTQLLKLDPNAHLFLIGMDYETFGEHFSESTGIFSFFENLVECILENETLELALPSEVAAEFPVSATFDCPSDISWADTEKDLSAWLGNSMQYEALHKVYTFADKLHAINHQSLLTQWRKLQTSDHFYYMSTKHHTDGAVHQYFSPFSSPYDAYIYYMNIISDFELIIKKMLKTKN